MFLTLSQISNLRTLAENIGSNSSQLIRDAVNDLLRRRQKEQA